MNKVVTVFGSGTCQLDSSEYQQAELLGKLLAEHGLVPLTGGYGGVMEAVSKGAKLAGGECIGIIMKQGTSKEPNVFLTEVIPVNNYTDRLLALVEGGSAFIILHGGTGTLLELSAVWALKERFLLPKTIICVGPQWQQTLETIAFYSESALESLKHVTFVKTVEEAVPIVATALSKL